jgi:hypothetical protein
VYYFTAKQKIIVEAKNTKSNVNKSTKEKHQLKNDEV